MTTNENWDLSLIYNRDDLFYEDLKQAKELLKTLFESKTTYLDSAENYLSFLQTNTSLSRLVQKMHVYAHLNCDVDPNNQTYQTMMSYVMSFIQDISTQLDFFEVDMKENEEKVLTFIKDHSFDDYRYVINETMRQNKHVLSQEIETLLSETTALSQVPSQAFDALRLEFPPLIINGHPNVLNSATLNMYLKNPSQQIRRTAYQQFFGEYKRFENVFAVTLSGVMNKDAFYAKVRKFNSPLEASLDEDNAPVELFDKILTKANKDYIHLFHKYNALKKKALGLKQFYNYDLNAPFIKIPNKQYSIDQSFKIIESVISIFGEDYLNIIKLAKTERWIDFHPKPGKRIGAYSSGSYDTRPYILMNYIGDYQSLTTLIHELGHSAHTYLSSQYQSPVNSEYRIFVAEVASTVNETLLINYMLEHARTKEEKAYFIHELLESCVGLMFRQPMYAAFEHELHSRAARNEPLSSQTITDLYKQMNEDYFGKDVILDEMTPYSCYYIPHFYYNYYVYKYTLGMTVSLAIVSRLLKGDAKQKEAYLNLLKSGGSEDPIDLLKHALVDPLDDQIYDDAFNYFETMLNELESLLFK